MAETVCMCFPLRGWCPLIRALRACTGSIENRRRKTTSPIAWPRNWMAAQADHDDAQALASTLAAAERGDVAATGELFAALYRELHRVARRQLHANASGLTLGATTLLHEAYLDLSQRGLAFPDRARFFAYAARAMRGLIIDFVRERRALNRGGLF